MAKTGGDCPSRFWQNERRRQAAAPRYITNYPPGFSDLQELHTELRTAEISCKAYVVVRDDLGLTSMEISQNHAHLIESLTD